jgi:hypothetical protein
VVLHSLNRHLCFLLLARRLLTGVLHRAIVTFEVSDVLGRVGMSTVVGEHMYGLVLLLVAD